LKPTAFKFGSFVLDSGRLELRRRGVRLKLPPSRFRLLLLFLSRPGELVTRDEIAACLWKDDQNVEVMNGINAAVKQLRAHLGDDPGKPKFIETVVGTGYRFIAHVEEISEPARPSEEPPMQLVQTASEKDPPFAPSIESDSVPAGHKWKLTLATAALLALAALSLLIWHYAPSFGRAAGKAELELTPATSSGDIRSADIAPDGKLIAFIRETNGLQTLWVKLLATDHSQQLAALGNDHCPGLAFSPDGNLIYFVRKAELNPNGVLYSIPAMGGNPTRILADISGAPAISPDGLKVAFIRSTLSTHGEDSVVTAGVDGSGERILASYKAPGIHFNRIMWTSDGSTLVFPAQSHLMAMPAAGGVAQPIPNGQWVNIDDLWALPPGRDLVVVGELFGALRSRIYTVSLPGGAIREITHDLSHYSSVRAAADGKTLLAVQDVVLSGIQVLAPGRESEPRAVSPESQNRDGAPGLAWTQDGKIVYDSEPDRRGEIWEGGGDGSNPRLLARLEAPAAFSDLAVSKRGDFIAVSRWFNGDVASIWRMDFNGRNERQLTNGKQDFPPSITPDGQWIVYGSVQGDKSILMKVPSNGGRPIQLTDYEADSPSVSPDGLWIACSTFPSHDNTATLAIVPVAGGPPVKTFQLPEASSPPLVWSSDGRSVAFINDMAGVGNIFAQPLAGGPAIPVTHFTSEKIFNFQWSRDGGLALSRGTKTADAVLIRNFR
jgi:Tol biopolymer transport system component/DNA-binding winged helix-turn-helix (wHTH) protein